LTLIGWLGAASLGSIPSSLCIIEGGIMMREHRAQEWMVDCWHNVSRIFPSFQLTLL
jgi:hypothetical protein